MGRHTVIRLKYVHAYIDRLGKERYYYRRHGRRVPLPGAPGSPEFMAAYNAAGIALQTINPAARAPVAPGSFAALAGIYFASPRSTGKSEGTRRYRRRVIEGFIAEYGHRPVKGVRTEHIEAILGKMADQPGKAIILLSCLRLLLSHAVRLGWIDHYPATDAASFKTKALHTWTEPELLAFEAHWPVGTKQRLAYALMLYTGQRGSDAHRLTWPDDGFFRFAQKKTGTELVVPVHPALADVLETTERRHAVMIMVNERGRPYSVDAFRLLLAKAINDAGLPSHCTPHGLRKAMARRLAEGHATVKQIAAITGHRSLSEIERYTDAADQPMLARQAFKRVGKRRG
jgi:integrase